MIFILLLFSNIVFAESKDSENDDFHAVSSTKFNFDEANIDGKMQAPAGFFLQGRKEQDLSQMVQLRSNFRNELKNSRSAVKSLIK